MRVIHDAVVVGGGPAGAVAAHVLASAGARVALVEKEQYPRTKVCAGGVTPRARALLQPILGSHWERAVLSEVRSVVVWAQGRSPLRFSGSEPLWHTVSREDFDFLLARSAAEAGAEVVTGWRVTGVEWGDSVLQVRSPRGVLLARAVIGADGARGVVARSLRIRPQPRSAPALEAEIPVPSGTERLRDEAWVDHGVVPMGYAWMFPKGDRISVGVSGLTAGNRLRPALRAFLATHSLALDEASVRGWMIPVWCRNERVSAGSVLLVGDAAGLADPLTGEGIYYAVRSATLAASALVATGFGPNAGRVYEASLTETVRGDLYWAMIVARLVGWSPQLTQEWLQRYPAAFEWLREVATGQTSYRHLIHRIGSRRVADLLQGIVADGGTAGGEATRG